MVLNSSLGSLPYPVPALCLPVLNAGLESISFPHRRNHGCFLVAYNAVNLPPYLLSSLSPHLLFQTFSLGGFLGLWCSEAEGRALRCWAGWPVSQTQAIAPTAEPPLIRSKRLQGSFSTCHDPLSLGTARSCSLRCKERGPGKGGGGGYAPPKLVSWTHSPLQLLAAKANHRQLQAALIYTGLMSLANSLAAPSSCPQMSKLIILTMYLINQHFSQDLRRLPFGM